MNTTIFSKAMRSKKTWGAAAALVATLALPGCTKQQLEGAASSYLIVESLRGSAGASTTFGDALASDVRTIVAGVGVRFSDNGQVTLRLAMKDPGTLSSPSSPSMTNFITVTRYTVSYTRVDGGTVPAAFEGSATATVNAGGAIIGLTLVRAQAKFESPLSDLVGGAGGGSISAVAEVTLFGTDQAGRAVSVKGFISVIFADWADPA